MTKPVRSALIGLFLLVLPCVAGAQFSALRWVDVPPVGAWAEYVRTQTVGQEMTYMTVKLAVVGREVKDGKEYTWLEISSEIDDLYEVAEDRVPYIARFYLTKEDFDQCEMKLVERAGDLVIKLGKRDPVRVPSALKAQLVEKGYLSGGGEGSGSCIDYKFQDVGKEKIQVEAGTLECLHTKGSGQSVVVTNTEAKRKASVTSDVDLWLRGDIPFGIVKSVNRIHGKGPDVNNVSLKVDTQETYSLKAFGTGASTAIRTEPKAYSLDQVNLKADGPGVAATPAPKQQQRPK